MATVLGAPVGLKYKISPLMTRHFRSLTLPVSLRSLPSRMTPTLRIRWREHKWRHLLLHLSMHAFNSTSFICTSTSYTIGLCLVHVTQESPTIEDSLGLPILDEAECGPDASLSHELLITPSLLLPIQPDPRMCMPCLLRSLPLFCKLGVGPLPLRSGYFSLKLLASDCILLSHVSPNLPISCPSCTLLKLLLVSLSLTVPPQVRLFYTRHSNNTSYIPLFSITGGRHIRSEDSPVYNCKNGELFLGESYTYKLDISQSTPSPSLSFQTYYPHTKASCG